MCKPAQSIHFLDLPPELLLEIFSYPRLSTGDLYNLAILCRRLNTLVLPVFLARQGIPEPESTIHISSIVWNPRAHVNYPRQPDILAGLQAATYLYRRDVREIICSFQLPNSTRNAFQSSDDLHVGIRRLTNFLSVLGKVDHVSLYLICEKRWIKHGPRDKQDRLTNWTADFARCLDELFLAKSIQSLRVQFDIGFDMSNWYDYRYQSPLPSGVVARSFKALRDVVHCGPTTVPSAQPKAVRVPCGIWEPREGLDIPNPPRLQTPLKNGALSRLTAMQIHSTCLLLPPILPYTLDVLSSAPSLHSLSFAHLSFPSPRWTALLQLIADACATKLTHFGVLQSCWGLSALDLLAFIDRLQGLHELKIDRTFQIRIEFESSDAKSRQKRSKIPFLGSKRDERNANGRTNGYPIPHFPLLERLEAPEEIILHLLRYKADELTHSNAEPTTNPPLPSLKFLTMYPNSLLVDATSYDNSMTSWNKVCASINARTPPSSPPVQYALDVQADFPLYKRMGPYLESRMIAESAMTARWADASSSANPAGELLTFSHVTELVLFHLSLEETRPKIKVKVRRPDSASTSSPSSDSSSDDDDDSDAHSLNPFPPIPVPPHNPNQGSFSIHHASGAPSLHSSDSHSTFSTIPGPMGSLPSSTSTIIRRRARASSSALFCQWLATLFPQLKTLRFTCALGTLERFVFDMDERTLAVLMRGLGEVCPWVERLVVAGRVWVRVPVVPVGGNNDKGEGGSGMASSSARKGARVKWVEDKRGLL